MSRNEDKVFSLSNEEINIYSGIAKGKIKKIEKIKLTIYFIVYLFFQTIVFYQYVIGVSFFKRGESIYLSNNPEGFYFSLGCLQVLSLFFLVYGLFNYYINKDIHFRPDEKL